MGLFKKSDVAIHHSDQAGIDRDETKRLIGEQVLHCIESNDPSGVVGGHKYGALILKRGVVHGYVGLID
jgi:hypothetical protein